MTYQQTPSHRSTPNSPDADKVDLDVSTESPFEPRGLFGIVALLIDVIGEGSVFGFPGAGSAEEFERVWIQLGQDGGCLQFWVKEGEKKQGGGARAELTLVLRSRLLIIRLFPTYRLKP